MDRAKAFSTLQGRYGFRATRADGTNFTELEFIWKYAPTDSPIVRLTIEDFTGSNTLAELHGLKSYFVLNEADMTLLEPHITAKTIGGITLDGSVITARIDLRSSGAVAEYDISSETHIDPRLLRLGLYDAKSS